LPVTIQAAQLRIDDYQERFVQNVRRIVETNFWQRSPTIRILDMGCDTSGRQLAHLASLTRGEVVGINVPEDFPTEAAEQIAGIRTTMVRMDGTNLSFPDNSFDLVISANVLEHVRDPVKYISEAARVTKLNGIAYFETAPVWTGPRGHHIHPDMIAENCPMENSFTDDGSVIPHWSHLVLSESELRTQLRGRLQAETIDYICHYVFHADDLNRVAWSSIRLAMEENFPFCRISPLLAEPPGHAGLRISKEDHRVHGFTAVCYKRKPNLIARRLIWRLRRLGF
jgi:ubiquinone/menaquinone biosynthesis C-methylase UbiE